MSVCKTSSNLTVHLGLKAILVNYTNVIVIAVFELHTLLIVFHRVSKTCHHGSVPKDMIMYCFSGNPEYLCPSNWKWG